MGIVRPICRPVARSIVRSIVAGDPVIEPEEPIDLCETNFGAWTAQNVTRVADQTDPNGGTLAYSIAANATDDRHRIYVGGASNMDSRSVIAKAGTASWLTISVSEQPGRCAMFDLANGTYDVPGVGSGTMDDLGDGWYLCEFTTDTNQSWLQLHPGATIEQATPGASYAGGGETVIVCSARRAGVCL